MTRFSRVIDESPPAKTLYLGAHTIVRMNPQQIVGMGLRNARERLVPRLPVDFDRRYERRVPADPPVSIDVLADNAAVLRDSLASVERRRHRTNARNVADGTMTLMNRSVSIEGGDSIDWYEDRFDEQSSLWRLKLYAFEWLGAAALGFEPSASEEAVRDALDALIGGWVESVDVGGERYLRRHWTPWSVSLRIQHWLRYLAWRRESADGMSPDAEAAFRREIYKNACFLRNHVEWDVGGNHLVENGAALLMAGIAFESVETDWIETGLSILESVADQQFLDDGCHFERSPMYHALVLTRYLTTQDLLERTGRPVPTSVRTVTAEATDFLRRLRPPDGRIPLLNDSVYGEAHSLDACLRYAGAVGVGRIEVRSDVPGTIREVPPTVSGYEWLRTDAGAMLVDGGPTGPPHLPGHGHSDTLGILLWIGDRPVITDTGTFDYVDGPRREYARGVRGHNTVQVGASEPIAIGGKYLMGPRPRPTARVHSGAVTLFEGRYEADPLGRSPYTHHRAVYAGDDWWSVRDTVSGGGEGPVRSRLHLHPAVTPTLERGRVSLRAVDEPILRVHPTDGTTIEIEDSWYYPRFGEAIRRPVLRVGSDGDDPATLETVLTTEDVGKVRCTTTADGTRRLRLDEIEHRLPTPKLHPAES